jgi:hypothetical protein
MTTRVLSNRVALLAILLLALVPWAFAFAQSDPGAGAVVQAHPAEQPATLRIVHRDLVTFRVTMLGYTPLQRVDGAVLRIIEAGRQNPDCSSSS